MSDSWFDATAFDAIPDDDVVGIVVEGRDLAFYKADGAIYATDNACTHGRARLCDGFLEGHEIECPLHQGRFDVRTGAPTGKPATVPVRVYPVKVESGRILVSLVPG